MATNGQTPKRKSVSKRELLARAADGTVSIVTKMEDANGARYSLTGGSTFDYFHGDNANQDRFFALFGFPTKVGNVVSTVINDKDAPGSIADADAEAAAFLAGTLTGVWAGEGGARVDRDALAHACVLAGIDAGKVARPAGDDALAALIAGQRAKLDDAEYFARVRQVDAVTRHYSTLVGKKALSVDEALSF